jgi:hypothetical protein
MLRARRGKRSSRASKRIIMEEIAMTSFVKPGTGTLAVLLGIGVMAAGAYAQQAAAAGNPATTKPDVQSAGGGYAVDNNGQPPTPISTVPLLYPKLTGTWAGTSPSPSLSEQFNKLLPKWLQFSGEFRERFEGYSGGSFKHDSTNDYDLQRIRLGMEIKPTSWVKFYMEMQDARVFGITPACRRTRHHAESGKPTFSLARRKETASACRAAVSI